MNKNTQEYSTAEKTNFSNKLNDLKKNFVQSKKFSDQSVINFINNSFKKNQSSNNINQKINQFVNISNSNKPNNELNNESVEKIKKCFFNSNKLKDFGNYNSTLGSLTNNSNSTNSQTLNTNGNIQQNKFILQIKNSKTISEKIENETEEFTHDNIDADKTARIKNKFITNFFGSTKNENRDEKKNKFFWFAAYDKLIKNKNIKKILNFYNKERINENSSIFSKANKNNIENFTSSHKNNYVSIY